MRLRYIGKDRSSQIKECPALYATDRGTYVVQGWRVDDPQALADTRDVAPNETFVEVPASVLDHYVDERAKATR